MQAKVTRQALLLVGVLAAIGLFLWLAGTQPPEIGPPAAESTNGLAVTTRAALTQVEPSPGAAPPVATDESPDMEQAIPGTAPVLNRQRADEVRKLLEAMYAGQLAASEQGNDEPVPPVSSQSHGNQVDKPVGDYVARVMREQLLPLASSCYERLLERSPRQRGQVSLEFAIMGEPSVGGVVVDASLGKETTLSDPEFDTCVRESMYGVVFDAPPEGHPTLTVRQALEFAP